MLFMRVQFSSTAAGWGKHNGGTDLGPDRENAQNPLKKLGTIL